mgnify:CR=1 FL=1
MKKIFSILFIILFSFTTKLFAEDSHSIKRISVGEKNAKITIIAYESLTCGHCADFHKNVYPDLKKKALNKGSFFDFNFYYFSKIIFLVS